MAAQELIKGSADIAINWCGGRHHAQYSRASGFCYVNDVVLAILELEKRFKRILCIDIDVHHGDGIEKAFLYSDKVYTVSFHQLEPGFFPGTGDPAEQGCGKGAGFNTNVGFKSGAKGETFVKHFKQVVQEVANRFKPAAVVLLCGADTLKRVRCLFACLYLLLFLLFRLFPNQNNLVTDVTGSKRRP